MRCNDCGERAQTPHLRYCENCGAKMPTPLPPGAVRTTGRARGTGTMRAISAREEAEAPAPRPHPVRVLDEEEHTDPGRPTSPPYDGPKWLEHIPGHSPSVLGVGLLTVALVLSVLPFFADVGPFWSLVVLAGGWLVVARELRSAGQQHALVDWVPESLLHPAVPAVYAVVTAALAIRMLGIGLMPLLWLGGAGLLGYDQYGKVYAGEDGLSRLFEPRQLVRGLAPVALGGVVLCLLALFLTWIPKPTGTSRPSTQVQGAPSGLRVADAPRPSDDVVYSMLDERQDTGWDQPLSVSMELLLLAMLGLLALRPEVPRPDWLRFASIPVVVVGLVWTLALGGLLLGPLLFLVGLAAVGFATVYQAVG